MENYFIYSVVIVSALAIFYLIMENGWLKKESEDYPLAKTLAISNFVSCLIGARDRLTDLLNGGEIDFAEKAICSNLLKKIEDFLQLNTGILSVKEVQKIAQDILEKEKAIRVRRLEKIR